MAQDYNLNYQGTQQLKGIIIRLIDDLRQINCTYAGMIESGHQNGMTLQMYTKLKGDNVVRMNAAINSLINNIEMSDLPWIALLLEGIDKVFAASKAFAGSSSGGGGDTFSSLSSATTPHKSKAEKFNRGTERIKEKAALSSIMDTGREENQHDMHTDYVTAILAEKSRQNIR